MSPTPELATATNYIRSVNVDKKMTSLSNPNGNPKTLEVETPSVNMSAPKRQISNLSPPKSKSSIAGACSNLVNGIVGAGVIGIPYALKESGLITGIILLVVVSFFTDKSLRMLVEMATFHPRLKGYGVLTFEDLMKLPFGVWGHHFVLFAMLITAYGAMVAYLLIVKDTLPLVLGFEQEAGEGTFWEREGVMLATSLCIMLPLSMLRDMSTLAYTSFFSAMCDTALVLFVAVVAPVKESVRGAGGFGPILKANWVNSGFFIGFGVLTIAMTCQHSAFIVSGSLQNLTATRWATVTQRSLVISCVLCAILGISGYLGFLDETRGDVLNNFDPDTLEATLARALLAITMFFTYPMEAFVARHVLIKLFFDGDMDGHTTDPTTGQVVKTPKILGCLKRRHLWTIVMYLASILPALIFNDLGPVLSFTGAIGGCSLAYIAPGLAYLGVHGEPFLKWLSELVEGKKSSPSTAVAAGDVPVEGDAAATMQVAPASTTIPSGSKPWWWYPILMPIWVKVASSGSQGLNERMTALEEAHGPLSPAEQAAVGNEVVEFRKHDAWFSIFFVVFGLIALVAGILSNIFASVVMP